MTVGLADFVALLAGRDKAEIDRLFAIGCRLADLDREREGLVEELARFGLALPAVPPPSPPPAVLKAAPGGEEPGDWPHPRAAHYCGECGLPAETQIDDDWYCQAHGEAALALAARAGAAA